MLPAQECDLLERAKDGTTTHVTYVPIMWACRIVDKAKREGKVGQALGHAKY